MACIRWELKAVWSLDGEEGATAMAEESSGGLRSSLAGEDSWRGEVSRRYGRERRVRFATEGAERGADDSEVA